MRIKQTFIGTLLILIGALPFLLVISFIKDFFTKYLFLTWIMPGEVGYQLLIILLGIWLIWRVKHRVEVERG